MMSYSVLDAVLDVFEYKDGYNLSRVNNELHIEWWARDARADYGVEAPELKPFLNSVPIPYAVSRYQSRSMAAWWLRKQLHNLECHEADESIRINGELWFDPHRGDR